MTTLVNTTKHAINLLVGGNIVELAGSSTPATMPTQAPVAPMFETQFGAMPCTGSPIFGDLVGLPEPQEGVVFFCSMLVFKAAVALGRRDVCCGDNSEGQPTSPLRWEADDIEVIEGRQRLKTVKAVTTLIFP